MQRPLQITPIQTKIFRTSEPILPFLLQSLAETPPKEGSILAITSKIVSLAESRTVARADINKNELISAEADYDLGEAAFGCRLTIARGLFIPSAGIDESNSESGDYILFPKSPYASARKIHRDLRDFFQLKRLGILITDSHVLPLRQGVSGIALAYFGFEGVRNRIGEKDLFGRNLAMTQMDLADGLAASAVLMMGEGSEGTPLALIENAPVKFCAETHSEEIQIPFEQDLYYPLYKERLEAAKRER